jgi:tRNA 2-thiouridine synthesizing protein E
MTSNAKDLPRDEEGYLVNPEDWTPSLAETLANEEQLQLSDDHWSAIKFIRSYYQEHQVAPDVRHVTSHLSDEWKIDKKKAKTTLFNMFPYGYVKQACKISGMKRPRAWSTG